MELLGRQNSSARSFVIGSAGSGKTQLLLALARQCTDAASSESLCLTPLFLKPGLVNEFTSFNDTPMRFVENLLKSVVNSITADNGMSIEDISTDGRSSFSSISSFAVALTNALLALCPARRLLLIYDANDAAHKGDIAVLNQACKAGCHVIISGQDDSVLDAWAIEESNCSSRTARPSPSLKLTMLHPERHFMAVGGVKCDPATLLGERSCAGVRNWWLLHNAVRFHMLSTPHNRHIASGSIPPFGPALRLQTWNRLIFDSLNFDGTRLSAYSLLFAESSPRTENMEGESIRDIVLVLGRVAMSQKCGNHVVNDAAFIKWLLAMPAYAGTPSHEARLVLFSLKRSGSSCLFCQDVIFSVTPASGLLISESSPAQSASDNCFRLCCFGVADAALSFLSSCRITAMLDSLWAWQSDAATWRQVLTGSWLHQANCREWLIFTLLRLKEAFRQRAITSMLSLADPTKADACILIQAYASILMEQKFSCESHLTGSDSIAANSLDFVQTLLQPVFESAQYHFHIRVCELARLGWWNEACHKAVLGVSAWVQDVALDCISRLRIDNMEILKTAANALASPRLPMSMKISAACTLGRIQISPSSVTLLAKCVAESGVHQELRKQCMISLLCVSSRLRLESRDMLDIGVESDAVVALNLLVVAAVRFACDVDKEVSRIARCICEEHQPRLLAFIYEKEFPHSFAKSLLVSGDCACASASAASTIPSFQGDEAVVDALLHLLKRGDKVASISAASALSIIADPSMRVVQECTDAFLNQHGSGDDHWSAARQVLAKTLCVLVARGVCPAAICRMCDVVVNGLEKVLGIKDRDAEMQEVAMSSSLTDFLRVASLESQENSRRYTVVDSLSQIRQSITNETFILRSDMVEAKRLAIHVIGRHVAAHGWVEGLLGLTSADNSLENASQIYDMALTVIADTAMTDHHDLQLDALATIVAFLKLDVVPHVATNVTVWVLETLTQETEMLHSFMNSAPSDAGAFPQKNANIRDDMDFALKDMFLPADMRLQSILVSQWQSTGQSLWLKLLARCKLVLGALRCEFIGKDTSRVSRFFDLCAHALQMLSRCLDLYDLPVKRLQLVDMVLTFWTTVNSCKFHSECSSFWAVAILSTSNSLSFGIVSPPTVPRFPSLIDERVVDSVKTHSFQACSSMRAKNYQFNLLEMFACCKFELWRMIVHLAANDGSVQHRAQWQRAAVAVAYESENPEWIAESRALLLSGLMDPTKVVRQTSAELFGSFVDERAELLRSLHPYLSSKSPDCRLRGIEASLVLFASPTEGVKEVLPQDVEAYLSLLSSMLDDENIAVRCAVIDAISQIDSKGVHFRKILQMMDDPAAEIRLASAKAVVGKKLRDVGVASVILGAISSGNARTTNIRVAELQAIDAISQVGANNPEEWAALLRCIGIAFSDSSENMSIMASASLAKGTGLIIRSAHAAMDIIPLLNDSTACGPAVQLLGSFCERFCCFPTVYCTPVPRTAASGSSSSAPAGVSPCISHLDANIRALPAACCRSISEAVGRLTTVDSQAPPYEPLALWWFCRVQGLIPCNDADFVIDLQWLSE